MTAESEVRELRDLLAAVLDALTLDDGVDDHDARLLVRARLARVVIRDGLDEPGWNADWLRSRLRAEESEAAKRAEQ